MRHPLRRLSLSLVLLAVLAPGGALLAQEDAAAAIAATNRAFQEAVAAGDAAAVAAVYTEDALLMAPNAPAAQGHEAIQAAMQEMLDMGVGSLTLTTDEVMDHGDTATEVGRYVLESTDGEHLDHGKFIVIWKRTGEGWRLHRDIFNSDMPPPGN